MRASILGTVWGRLWVPTSPRGSCQVHDFLGKSPVVPCSPRLDLLHTHEVRRFESSSANHLNHTAIKGYVARRPPQIFSWGRFGGGLVLGRTTFRILTALVESSDDGMIGRLQLEGFHVSSERVIEVG